jgi:hypothetical protein
VTDAVLDEGKRSVEAVLPRGVRRLL